MSNEEQREDQEQERDLGLIEEGQGLSIVSRAEIDMQIATAHAYPRSITRFINDSMTMLLSNKETAMECFYTLPRAGKSIQGPSVRLAEIVASCYGNLRVKARVTEEGRQFVTAEGLCHDLQNNLAISFEVKRRITDKAGRRYNEDMIGTTGNAASSIALRNSVFRVVPKMLWLPLYNKARDLAKGDEKTLDVRVDGMLAGFEKLKISRKQIFEFLGVEGAKDISLDQLVELVGIGNGIKNGEINPDTLFVDVVEEPQPKRKSQSAQASPATEQAKPTTEKPKPAAAETAPAQTSEKTAAIEEAKPEERPKPTEEERCLNKEELSALQQMCFSRGMSLVDANTLLREHFPIGKMSGLSPSQLDRATEIIKATPKK